MRVCACSYSPVLCIHGPPGSQSLASLLMRLCKPFAQPVTEDCGQLSNLPHQSCACAGGGQQGRCQHILSTPKHQSVLS